MVTPEIAITMNTKSNTSNTSSNTSNIATSFIHPLRNK